jgi:hypothetical protein
MKKPKRRKARPLLIAVASTATLGLVGCGGDVHHVTGNLLPVPYDLSVKVDQGPSGNLMAPPPDMTDSD